MDNKFNFNQKLYKIVKENSSIEQIEKEFKKIQSDLRGLEKIGDKLKFILNASRPESVNSSSHIYKKFIEEINEEIDLLMLDASEVKDLQVNKIYTKKQIGAFANFWNLQTGILFDKKSDNVFITINTQKDYIYKTDGKEFHMKNVIDGNLIKYYAQSNGHNIISIYNSSANNQIRNKVGTTNSDNQNGFIFAFETIKQNEYKYLGRYITKQEFIEVDKATNSKILGFNLCNYDSLKQEEKNAIINYSEYENIKIFENIVSDELPYEEVETKKALVKVRWQQGRWRKQLIQKYDEGCVLTKIKNEELLIASHIKPHNKCSREEATDVENGLLLSALADKLFDRGLITFKEDGQIIFSKELEKNNDIEKIKQHISENIQIKMSSKMQHYMRYHFNHLFVDNSK